MVVANLNFTGAYTPPAAAAVALNFGAQTGGPADPSRLSLVMPKPAPLMSLGVAYESNVSRPFSVDPDLRWQAAIHNDLSVGSNWLLAVNSRIESTKPWAQARALHHGLVERAGQLDRLPEAVAVPWARATSMDAHPLAAGYEEMIHLRQERLMPWQWGIGVSRSGQEGFVQLVPFKHNKMAVWQDSIAVRVLRHQGFSVGQSLAFNRVLPWQKSRPAAPGREQPATLPPINVREPDYDLNFVCKCLFPSAQAVMLNFGSVQCLEQLAAVFNILPARFYMTINTVTAELLPSLAPVPIYAGATISQDVGSYAWTLSATGPASLYSQLAAVPGQPKILRVTINGIAFVFQLDSPRRSQSFGKTEVQITGRSVTASLGTGFARETTRLSTNPFNAQQLAAQALDGTGVSLDWGIEDWLVPAGAWSHSGTPLAAVQAIAEAAGGYVQSHRTLAQLLVRHPYPLLPGGVPGGPWNWYGAFAADVVLAPDVIISRSVEVRQAAAINAVYVSGETQGVLALVKRTGTAGDLLGAMVVDPLINSGVAATQRGTAILGAGGNKLMHQLELPVLVGAGQPGVLSTDQLIQVQDSPPWRGRVRAVSVTHQRPQIRQTVLVEAA